MKKRKYYYQGLFKLHFCEVEIQSSWELHAKAVVKIVNQWVFSQYDVKLKLYFATVNSVLINPCGLNVGSWKKETPIFLIQIICLPVRVLFSKSKPEICIWRYKQLHGEKKSVLSSSEVCPRITTVNKTNFPFKSWVYYFGNVTPFHE